MLLHKYPKSLVLLTNYSTFQDVILNHPKTADTFRNTIAIIELEGGGGGGDEDEKEDAALDAKVVRNLRNL